MEQEKTKLNRRKQESNNKKNALQMQCNQLARDIERLEVQHTKLNGKFNKACSLTAAVKRTSTISIKNFMAYRSFAVVAPLQENQAIQMREADKEIIGKRMIDIKKEIEIKKQDKQSEEKKLCSLQQKIDNLNQEIEKLNYSSYEPKASSGKRVVM